MTSPRPGYSSHFGINNIPFGVASSTKHPKPSCVTRFEDNVIFLSELHDSFASVAVLPKDTFEQSSLNTFAALPLSLRSSIRKRIQEVIKERGLSAFPPDAVEPIESIAMHLPIAVRDFTDFSCSSDHVQNASEAMTGKRSVPPAFYHMPIGYAGRCSSLDISGTPVERPLGQFWAGKPGESEVVFGPCRKMDYELELGCIIGEPLARRRKILAANAAEHVFGYVLVNDWSARDIQGLEMNPLGPLNGKNAGTTVSPWVVTVDALEAFRAESPPRVQKVVPYLADSGKAAFNIELEARISTPGTDDKARSVACKSNSAWMYWTLDQCVAHQAIGGCGLSTGDLLATGTVSGSGDDQHGCLMEHMRAGTEPPRSYLQDGETVTLTGYCGDGVGFGECVATLTPAKELAV